MCSSREVLEIQVQSITGTYVSKVCGDVNCGEFIRNVCVNIGIDPDTSDGITRNVIVYLGSSKIKWNYNPHVSICDITQLMDTKQIRVEECIV